MKIRVGDRVRIVAGMRAAFPTATNTLIGMFGTVVAIDTMGFLDYEVQLDGDPADCPTPFDRDELVYTS